jgi:hypothetical protein
MGHTQRLALPAEIVEHRPQPGKLDEHGMRVMGKFADWFDTEQIAEIARDGIDLESSMGMGSCGNWIFRWRYFFIFA